MKNYFLLIVLFMGINLYSQIEFEKGYFINNSGDKVDCLIKNSDWNFNPEDFKYKLTETAEIKDGSIAEIREFKVGEFYFIRRQVDLDMSSDVVSDLSGQRAPEFQKQIVFLRLMVDGKADLFSFQKNGLNRFYYRIGGGEIKPLIYKRFQVNQQIRANNYFQQQLINELQCEGANAHAERLRYSIKDLSKYIMAYNECKGSESQVYFNKSSKGILLFKPVIAAGFGSMDVESGINAAGEELTGPAFRIGGQMEYLLPFNKYKWSLLLEVAYESFKSDATLTRSFDADLKVNYSSLNAGFLIRHYFFLNNDSKIFANIGINFNSPMGSEVLFDNTNRNLDPVLNTLNSGFNPMFGAGYSLKKLSLELRYDTRKVNGRNFVPENYDLRWKSNYSLISLSLAYSIF